jgi:hypothetical protein
MWRKNGGENKGIDRQRQREREKTSILFKVESLSKNKKDCV